MRRLPVFAALLAALMAAAPALAQDQPPPPEPPQAGAPPPPPRLAGRIEDRMAELHRRLHITPAQQPHWDAFVQVWRENMAHAGHLARAAAESGNATAVDDLRALAAAAKARADDVQRLIAPFDALYAALTAEQRKLADAAMRDFLQRGMRPPPR